MVKKCSMVMFLVCRSFCADAQVKCFAEISLDRHSVYVQQPFRVTITVLTATWYTAPLEFDNIRLPNAFVLPFDQTAPGMYDVKGRQYAGLQFYFIVFPYEAGTFTLPAIHITAHTPAEGESEGRKVILATAAQEFIVRPVPVKEQEEPWFVAKNVIINQHWSRPLKDLKVGNVIERTVTIYAGGTLPQFIPPLTGDSLDFADTYVQNAELHDARDDYDANGRLTQSLIYLLEKQGDLVLPAIGVTWWNPNSNKLYTRHAPAAKIHVNANTNLGMLATLRDSLHTNVQSNVAAPAVKSRRTILGMAWYWGIAVLVAGALVLYWVTMSLLRLWRYYRRQHALYLSGESYAFRRLMRSSPVLPVFIPSLYCWWDRSIFPGKTPSIGWWMRGHTDGPIPGELRGYFRQMYRSGGGSGEVKATFRKEIKAYRKALMHRQDEGDIGISADQTSLV